MVQVACRTLSEHAVLTVPVHVILDALGPCEREDRVGPLVTGYISVAEHWLSSPAVHQRSCGLSRGNNPRIRQAGGRNT